MDSYSADMDCHRTWEVPSFPCLIPWGILTQEAMEGSRTRVKVQGSICQVPIPHQVAKDVMLTAECSSVFVIMK